MIAIVAFLPIIALAVTAVAAAVSTTTQIMANEQAEQAQEEALKSQQKAEEKAENLGEAQNAIQERLQARNETRLRDQLGSTIAKNLYDADIAKHQAINTKAEARNMGETKVTTLTSWPAGKPAVADSANA